MKVTIQKSDGFTLIEVLIAIAIMAIGILTVITMQLTSIKGNLHSNNISVASNWAADRIERIFALDYTNDPICYVDNIKTNTPIYLEDNTGDDEDALNDFGLNDLGNDADSNRCPPIQSPDGFFTIYWNVAENHLMPNTRTVRVIVERKDMGITKYVRMDYLKAEMMN